VPVDVGGIVQVVRGGIGEAFVGICLVVEMRVFFVLSVVVLLVNPIRRSLALVFCDAAHSKKSRAERYPRKIVAATLFE
jgi:hypothetical protein